MFGAGKRPRTLAVTIAGLMMLGSLGGCARPQVIRDGGVVLMVGTAGEAMDALVPGTLGVTEAGCMGITDEISGETVPAVWPPGTRLALDGQAVSYDGRVIEIGEPVIAGGGIVSSAGLEPPEECVSAYYAVLWEIQ